MGIVKGSHFYIHLITQTRPEYIIGIRPPNNEEETLHYNSYGLLGNQELKNIYHFRDDEDKLHYHSFGLLGNQSLRDIKHTYNNPPENWHYNSVAPLGNQEMKSIYRETNSEDNLHYHSYGLLGDQELKFAVLVGWNRFDGDEDKDRWLHSFGLLGNQELKEV